MFEFKFLNGCFCICFCGVLKKYWNIFGICWWDVCVFFIVIFIIVGVVFLSMGVNDGILFFLFEKKGSVVFVVILKFIELIIMVDVNI